MLKKAFSLARQFSSKTYPPNADLSSTTGTFYVSSSSLRPAKWLANSGKISFLSLNSHQKPFLLENSIQIIWLPSIMIRKTSGANQKWCLLNIFPSIHLHPHFITAFSALRAWRPIKMKKEKSGFSGLGAMLWDWREHLPDWLCQTSTAMSWSRWYHSS